MRTPHQYILNQRYASAAMHVTNMSIMEVRQTGVKKPELCRSPCELLRLRIEKNEGAIWFKMVIALNFITNNDRIAHEAFLS